MYDHDHENEIIPFAETNYRNGQRRFGVKTDDRRRHVYLLGKTGMGKTTMLENMIMADINAGHGCAYIDPHGDTAEKLIDFIPPHRINDVVYFNPSDVDFPIGFNVLESIDPTNKHLVASGLMGVFKKIWPDVWSARMEHILNNCILALLDFPGSTLLGINRLLVDTEYRRRVISKIEDPIVKMFWLDEYAKWEMKFRTEAIQPIQNKVGQFLSASIIRNIVAQVKSSFDIRKIMDEGKILIVNLAKGRIGEDNSRLLGGMLITKLQMAAMERVDLPELDRRDFYLYVDEFQNFATQSFANILSEARKYRLNLVIAHQYIEQLDEDYVRPAIFGNVGTIIIFRIGAKDAEFLEQEFTPRLLPEDLVNLTKFEIYLKLMIDGVTSEPFSAKGMAPISQRQSSAEKVVRVSRERYTEPRAVIEEKVLRWTGTAQLTPEVIATMPMEPQGMQKKPKQLYDYICTRCKKDIKLPVKLDPSRPIYCEACLPLVRGVTTSPSPFLPEGDGRVRGHQKEAEAEPRIPSPSRSDLGSQNKRSDLDRISPPSPSIGEGRVRVAVPTPKTVSLETLKPRPEVRPHPEVRPRRRDLGGETSEARPRSGGQEVRPQQRPPVPPKPPSVPGDSERRPRSDLDQGSEKPSAPQGGTLSPGQSVSFD